MSDSADKTVSRGLVQVRIKRKDVRLVSIITHDRFCVPLHMGIAILSKEWFGWKRTLLPHPLLSCVPLRYIAVETRAIHRVDFYPAEPFLIDATFCIFWSGANGQAFHAAFETWMPIRWKNAFDQLGIPVQDCGSSVTGRFGSLARSVRDNAQLVALAIIICPIILSAAVALVGMVLGKGALAGLAALLSLFLIMSAAVLVPTVSFIARRFIPEGAVKRSPASHYDHLSNQQQLSRSVTL